MVMYNPFKKKEKEKECKECMERNEKENVGVLVVKEHFSLLVTLNFPRQAGKDS